MATGNIKKDIGKLYRILFEYATGINIKGVYPAEDMRQIGNTYKPDIINLGPRARVIVNGT